MTGDPEPIRALFVNSGILGHGTVARLIQGAVAGDPGIDAEHVDLSAGLSTAERVVRRLASLGPVAGTAFPGAWLTLPRFRREWFAGWLAARRIAALERGGRAFEVLHFHTQATAWGSLARMRRTPAIVSIDATQRLASLEVASAAARREYGANADMDRRVFQRAAAIVATSRWAADDLLLDLPEAADRVHVMPYPVPLEGFGAGWAEERLARAASGPVRVLFIGGDFPRKGGPGLLEAWRIGGFEASAALTLVTDWPLDLADLPAGVAVRRGVRAYTPEWLKMWREADLFVMPTRGEAFGMVFQEAAAAGLPVVGTRINAVPEIVADGETGLLVPPGDGRALAGAMQVLVASAERRREMGTAARRRIEQVASPAWYAERLTGLVRAVARR